MPLRRIFDLGVGFVAGYTPSGSVSSGAAGARASRSSTNDGEDEGSDCFYYLVLEVMFTKLRIGV
jgi:hypothetical protein